MLGAALHVIAISTGTLGSRTASGYGCRGLLLVFSFRDPGFTSSENGAKGESVTTGRLMRGYCRILTKLLAGRRDYRRHGLLRSDEQATAIDCQCNAGDIAILH